MIEEKTISEIIKIKNAPLTFGKAIIVKDNIKEIKRTIRIKSEFHQTNEHMLLEFHRPISKIIDFNKLENERKL